MLHAKAVQEVEAQRRSESRKQRSVQQQTEPVCVMWHLLQHIQAVRCPELVC